MIFKSFLYLNKVFRVI